MTSLNFDLKLQNNLLYVLCLVFLLDLTNYHYLYDLKEH